MIRVGDEMNKEVYLDNNATTRCDEQVFQAMIPFFQEKYGNPSSIYSLGKEVKEKIIETRRTIAQLLHAHENEIIFTSCASESNVTAIMNAVKTYPEKRHIITTQIEHASIMETMKYLESIGYRITYLPVDAQGRLHLQELENAISDDTLLITIMYANNETGNLYPIKEIGQIAKKHHILFHCDAVQAIGKLDVDVHALQVDTLSFSGHKIHAPKGIGVLYVKKDIPFSPFIFGHQEHNRRGGTENVPYIIGLGKAVELLLHDDYQVNDKCKKLRDYMETEIKKHLDGVVIYGDLDNRLPNTSSMAFKDVNAEELMLLLESFGIFVSTGSACNSEVAEPSHVLTACHADMINYSPIRISLGKYNTKADIDFFIKTIIRIVPMLRKNKKGE